MVCRIIIGMFVVLQVICGKRCLVGTHGKILSHCGATSSNRAGSADLYATAWTLSVTLKDEELKCAVSLLLQADHFQITR